MPPNDSLKNISIDNLPKILNFDDEQTPILAETRERIIETARSHGTTKAAAVANTYERLAEDLLDEQLDESRRHPAVVEQQIKKAHAGLLVNIAKIWRDAGAADKCAEALERAIGLARANRWPSIVTALESEKRKLSPSGM